MKATIFLGGGRITSAIAAGLHLSGYKRPVVVFDRNPQKLKTLRRESRIRIAHDLESALEQAEIVIVAVRPVAVKDLLRNAALCGARPKLWVSLAAGIPLKKLKSLMGAPTRWARAMPSPVSRIGRGLTALTFDSSVRAIERKRIREVFACVGAVVEIPEAQFDAFTATYSSSHGYHALASLARAAESAGLDRATALAAAAHALGDGMFYWQQSGLNLEELLAEAVTPGGIAAATMAAMDKSGFVRSVRAGLNAGIRQARRNARR